MTPEKRAALQLILLNVANDDDTSIGEGIQAVLGLFGCDTGKTLRDEIAMGVLNAYINSDESGTSFWRTKEQRAEVVAEAYSWADSVLEGKK